MGQNTVLVVDTSSRKLLTFAGAATALPQDEKMIVIRKGAEIGRLGDLAGSRTEYPLIVTKGGFSSQASAGHVTVLGDSFGERNTVWWVGGAGFGVSSYDPVEQRLVRRGDALRPLRPRECYVVPAGAVVEAVINFQRSNPSTAAATLAALKMRARTALVIAEGQSDYTLGWVLRQPEAAEPLPAFPPEHRGEFFSPARLAEELVHNRANPAEDVAKLAVAGAVRRIRRAATASVELPELSGIERTAWPLLEAGAEAALAAKLSRGWKYGVQTAGEGRWLMRVTAPDGRASAHELHLGSDGAKIASVLAAGK